MPFPVDLYKKKREITEHIRDGTVAGDGRARGGREGPLGELELGSGEEGPDGLVGRSGVAQPVQPEDEATPRHWIRGQTKERIRRRGKRRRRATTLEEDGEEEDGDEGGRERRQEERAEPH